jgi:hypothetical protein
VLCSSVQAETFRRADSPPMKFNEMPENGSQISPTGGGRISQSMVGGGGWGLCYGTEGSQGGECFHRLLVFVAPLGFLIAYQRY